MTEVVKQVDFRLSNKPHQAPIEFLGEEFLHSADHVSSPLGHEEAASYYAAGHYGQTILRVLQWRSRINDDKELSKKKEVNIRLSTKLNGGSEQVHLDRTHSSHIGPIKNPLFEKRAISAIRIAESLAVTLSAESMIGKLYDFQQNTDNNS